jgi:hypothetical protein
VKDGHVIVIRDFHTNFIVSQAARIRGTLPWIAIPTKHDGKSFRRIMQHDHGAAIYGAWCLMIQIAAKCPAWGVVADDDGPLTFEDLELKTGCPSKVFREATEVLSSKGIAWIEVLEWNEALRVDSESSRSTLGARSVYVTERNGTERNETKSVRTEGGSDSEKLSGGDDADVPEIACLKQVQNTHLGNTRALVELADRIRHDHPGHLPDGNDGLLRIIAAAERAKSQGKQPAKLFRWIVRNSRWDMLDGQEKATARKRLKEFQEPQ